MGVGGLGINGAIISSIISQVVAAVVVFIYLKRNIDIKFGINKFLLKPIVATIGMIISMGIIYGHFIEQGFSVRISFLIAILLGGIIYLLLILILKILSKNEFLMLPYGEKLQKALERVKLL